MTICIANRIPNVVSEFNYDDKLIVKKILNQIGTLVRYKTKGQQGYQEMVVHNLPFDDCVRNPSNAKERMLIALFGRLFTFDNGRLTHRERNTIRLVRSFLPEEFGGEFKTDKGSFEYRVIDDKISIYHKGVRVLRTPYYQFSKNMKETLHDRRTDDSQSNQTLYFTTS